MLTSTRAFIREKVKLHKMKNEKNFMSNLLSATNLFLNSVYIKPGQGNQAILGDLTKKHSQSVIKSSKISPIFRPEATDPNQ